MAPPLATILVRIGSLRVICAGTGRKVDTCANSFVTSVWFYLQRSRQICLQTNGILRTMIIKTWHVGSWAWYFIIKSHRACEFLPHYVLRAFTDSRAQFVDSWTWCF